MTRHLLAVDIRNMPLSPDKTIGQHISIAPFINSFLTNSLVIAGIILVALILFGGFSMIASAGSGDSKKAEQSKKTITSAVIGFLVVISAYFIIQVIERLFGLNILNNTSL